MLLYCRAMPKPTYKRILLKLSGQVLAGDKRFGLDYPTVSKIATEINEVSKQGIEIVMVIGGGNIWRYRDTTDSGIERTASDGMGMLATIMNSVCLQSALESIGAHTRVCSAIDVPQLAEPFLMRRALRHLEKGRIVICAGGTGNPYFTTDSAAALRALELSCDVVMKATDVDGVYDKDPQKHKDAKLYKTLTYQEAIEKDLQVMDQAAFSLCREQKLPIRVFNLHAPGAMLKVAKGEDVGTLIHS